eukprot:42256_1
MKSFFFCLTAVMIFVFSAAKINIANISDNSNNNLKNIIAGEFETVESFASNHNFVISGISMTDTIMYVTGDNIQITNGSTLTIRDLTFQSKSMIATTMISIDTDCSLILENIKFLDITSLNNILIVHGNLIATNVIFESLTLINGTAIKANQGHVNIQHSYFISNQYNAKFIDLQNNSQLILSSTNFINNNALNSDAILFSIIDCFDEEISFESIKFISNTGTLIDLKYVNISVQSTIFEDNKCEINPYSRNCNCISSIDCTISLISTTFERNHGTNIWNNEKSDIYITDTNIYNDYGFTFMYITNNFTRNNMIYIEYSNMSSQYLDNIFCFDGNFDGKYNDNYNNKGTYLSLETMTFDTIKSS